MPTVLVILLLSILIFGSSIFLSQPSLVRAADLSQASIKLSRQKANTSPGPILVQLRTTENVVEDGIRLTVGQAWNISAAATDYTVSTASLPAGVTALPGIATAQTVVGQTMTFPASDLASGTTYGFYLTGGIASNPATGSGVNYVWSIATLVAGVSSSSQSISVPIVANDQIVINATVGPTVNDFSAVLTTPTTGTLSPGNIVTYTITYGSSYLDDSPVTLQAEWELGTLAGGLTPTIAVFEYVDSSATQAYGATDPVIDSINRTITWTIPNFPASTQNQIVNFQLQVANINTGTTLVSVPVSARIIVPVSTPDSTITHQYQYTNVTPTSTPTVTPRPAQDDSQPTNTPTPSTKKACNTSCATDTECDSNYCYMAVQRCRDRQTPKDENCGVTLRGDAEFIEGPSKSDTALIFRSVNISQISHQSADLEILLSQASSIVINYGIDATDLIKQVSSTGLTKLHQVELTQLEPATTYYFQAQTTNSVGKTVKSNIYQLTTAQRAFDFDLTKLQTMVTTGGLVLFNQTDQANQTPVVLPTETHYEINISFNQTLHFLHANLVLRGEEQTQIILTTTKPGTLNGKHVTGNEPRDQEVMLKVEDEFGNLRLVKLFTLVTSNPLRVVASETFEPVEHARLILYLFNPKSKKYDQLPAPAFIGENPLYSLSSGEFKVALPPGDYRAEISSYGFHSMTKDFTIGGQAQGLYPTIELSSAGWNIVELVKYYYGTVQYKVTNIAHSLTELRSSKVLFDLMSLLALCSLIGLTFFSFAARLGVSLRHLPKVISHRLWSMKNPHLFWLLQGVVVDQDHKAVSHALISAVGHNRQVITQFSSDVRGRFNLRLSEPTMLLLVTAKGFMPLEQTVTEAELTGFTQYVITLNHSEEKTKLLHFIAGLSKVALEGFFEMLLFLALLMEVIFIPHFGLLVVLPFIMLSSLNLAMWLVHLLHEQMQITKEY